MSQDSNRRSAQPADPTASGAAATAQIEVTLDSLGALLGGAEAKLMLAEHADASALIATLDAPRAWLSPGITASEPSAGVLRQFTLEIASLKLRCFEALVRLLIGNRHVGGLPTARVRARMLDQPGAIRPARWAFELKLDPSSGATNVSSLGLDLGNLLARLLLTNDGRTPAKAEHLAMKALQEFSVAASKLKGASKEQIDEAALAVLARSDIANSSSVVHPARLRNRLSGTVIPPSIWLAITKLILRLQTRLEGFSFGEAPLLDLYAEIATLGQQLDVATFGAMARRTEIEAVVRSQLKKLDLRS